MNSINVLDLSFINNTKISSLSIGYISDCSLENLSGNLLLNNLELNNIKNLSDISIIKELHNLKYLSLNQLSQLNKIPSLSNSVRLEHIILDSIRNLKDIYELEFAPNLKYVEMYQVRLLEVQDTERVLNNKSLLKVKCTTGSVRKDRLIKELIESKNLSY